MLANHDFQDQHELVDLLHSDEEIGCLQSISNFKFLNYQEVMLCSFNNNF